MLALATIAPPPIASPPVQVENYLYLAEIIARKFYRGRELIQDTELYSVACMELVSLVENYDPRLGEFSRFAFRSLYNRLVGYIRYTNRKSRRAKLEALTDKQWQDVPDKHREEVPLPVELLPTLLQEYEDESAQDRQDKLLLKQVYLEGEKVAFVADRLGTSRMTVYTRLKRIIERIRSRHAALLERHVAELVLQPT
jgi:RNA polymerase sigma factor (sigma-70 family)